MVYINIIFITVTKEISALYVDMKKKYALIEISIANIEDIIFMLSREVTRRTGDFAEEQRAYNTGGR